MIDAPPAVRVALMVGALSLTASRARAQPTANDVHEPRWTLGALASVEAQSYGVHLSGGQLGAQGALLLRRVGPLVLRAEGRVSQFLKNDPDPTAIWCDCDRRRVRALAAVGVGSTIELSRMKLVPYGIASVGGYGTLWKGGADNRGPQPAGRSPAEASGVGPGGVLLGAGLGWRLGGGRTPLRLELRHETYARRDASPARFVSGGLAVGW